MKKIVLFSIFVMCFVSYLNADTTTWTGVVSSDWDNASNWTNGVPVASTSVIIPSSVKSNWWPVVGPGSRTCNDIANNGTLGISGGTLNTEYGFTGAAGSTTSLSGSGALQFGNTSGDFDCDGTVNINDIAVISGNNFRAGPGSTVNQGGGYLSLDGDFDGDGIVNISDGSLLAHSFLVAGSVNQTWGTVDVSNQFEIEPTGFYQQSNGTLNLRGGATFNGSLVNTGSTGQVVFNGGTTQNVLNPSVNSNTNMVPSVVVNNNSSVYFGEKVSFYADNVTVQNGTLDVGPGHLGEINSGQGTLLLDGGTTLGIGGDNTMPVFGTYTMNPTSTVDYNSTTSTQEIKNLTYPTLEVSGTTKYIENGDVTVQNQLLLSQVIDLRGNDLILGPGATIVNGGTYHVATTSTGSLKMENVSSGSYPIGPYLTSYNGFAFDNNGTTLSYLSARVVTGVTPAHPNDIYCLSRTWEIQKEGVLDADFTFMWTADQENANFTDARVNNRIQGNCCHTPPSWQVVSTPTSATGTGTISDPYRVDFGGMAIVSGFALGDGDHTLPVELSAFNAVYSMDNGLEFVQVNWTTATETDVLGFNIYQSVTDEFEDVERKNTSLIHGHGTTTVSHSYSYDDLDTDPGCRNYYWLEQIDYSGLSELFGPAVYIPDDNVDPNNDTYAETKVITQYPNPVENENNLKIEYQLKGSVLEQNAIIHIYNMKGEFIDTVFGQNGEAEIDLSRFATGVYFYRLQDTSFGETYKFVVIR